jgi:apolipoprotein N-acyltransferase
MQWASQDLAQDLRRGIAPALGSGLLCALLFYPYDLWVLGPVCLVPLLLALRRTESLRAAAYLALIFGWAFALAALPWLWSIFSTGAIGVCIMLALPWALFGLAYRTLSPRVDSATLVLAAPVLFTAAEWVRCQGWYFRFSWLQLGASYVASSGSQSTYPLIGVYGLTFLTVLVNAVVAEAVRQKSSRARLQGLAAAAALVAVLVLAFRVAWLVDLQPQAESYDRSVKVLLVQSETEDLDWFVDQTHQYAGTKPQLIVWPELAVNDYVEDDPATLGRLQSLARELGAVLVLGCKSHVPAGVRCDWLRRRAMRQAEGNVYYNSALIIGPTGDVMGRYHKRHPIQLFADGVPGPGHPVFPTPAGKLGVAICYDLDFADTALSLTRHGAELLVVPTYDAYDWGRLQQVQHARLALARAAEVRRCVVRPTSSGVSQIIAPGGEQVTFLARGPASLTTGVVGLRDDLTPYVRFVWLLPYACLVVSVLVLGWVVVRDLRPGR